MNKPVPASPAQILKSLRWKADMLITNHFGEVVWLKECFAGAKRIGITECCPGESPCEWHKAISSRSRLEPVEAAKDDKRPIDRPCSACSAGDWRMEHHTHKPPFSEPVEAVSATATDEKPDLPTPTGVMCACCGHESFKNGGPVLCDYCFLKRLQDSRHQCKPKVGTPLPQQEEPAHKIIGESEPISAHAEVRQERDAAIKAVKAFMFLEQTNGGLNPHREGTNKYRAFELGITVTSLPCAEFVKLSTPAEPIAPLLGQEEPKLDVTRPGLLGSDQIDLNTPLYDGYQADAYMDQLEFKLTQALTSLAAANEKLDHRFDQVSELVARAQLAEQRLELAEAPLAEAQTRIGELEKELGR